MSGLAAVLCLWFGAVAFGAVLPPPTKLQAVPFNQVEIQDRFWSPKQETNRVASIAVNLEMLVKAGNLKNFELAAAGKHEGYSGPVFMD